MIAAAVPLLGAVALSAGCTAAEEQADPAASATPPTTASAPPPSPVDQPTPSAGGSVTIPKSAFVELPSELRKVPRRATPVGDALPKLCGGAFGTDGRQVTASAAMTVTYKKAGEPASNVPQGMIHQTIFTFGGDGASDYMGRLRDAVEACPSDDQSGSRVDVQGRPLPGVGDEALLLTRTWAETSLDGERTGGSVSSQIAVARVHEAVTILDDQGWEGSSGNPAIMDRVVRDAVRSIDAWQR
ncbi:hypothetical protein ACVCAH_25165 [Micromonospora sp. LZ34]